MTVQTDDGKQKTTKLERIGMRARFRKDTVFNNIGHVIDLDLLRECYWQLNGNKAVGTDGISKASYGVRLEDNLQDLLGRIRRNAYKPQASRLIEIPKEDGSTRPLAISCFEDKIAQHAVKKILSAIFEPKFLACSYGYREGKNGHEALRALMKHSNRNTDGITVEIDLNKYFNTIPHNVLQGILREKISDRRFLKLSDDMVFVFELKEDAERFYRVLPKRLEKYGLTLCEDKSSRIRSGSKAAEEADKKGERLQTYDFLGFTCYWAKSRNGWWRMKYKSRSDRFTGKLKGLRKYLRDNLNQETSVVLERVKKTVVGWVNYHAISDNQQRVSSFIMQSKRALFNWINRKGGNRKIGWKKFGNRMKQINFPQNFKTTSMFVAC